MLVQLTERNLMLGEKIEEMRITIEDLEALKELNDELEENHIETEKALQEEIGAYHVVAQQKRGRTDSWLQTRRTPRSASTCKRYRRWKTPVKIWRTLLLSSESLCYSFKGNFLLSILIRTLVNISSSELDNLRTQTQTAQHESATAVSQTAAMMSLNLKLQSSAAKNQAKTVELEIRKLEGKESRELLGIVQVTLMSISCFTKC